MVERCERKEEKPPRLTREKVFSLFLALALMGGQVGCNSNNEKLSKLNSPESLTSSDLGQQEKNLGFHVVRQEPPYKQRKIETIKTYYSNGSYAIVEKMNPETVPEGYIGPTYHNYTLYGPDGKEIYSISELGPTVTKRADSIEIEKIRDAVHVSIGNPDDGYIFDEVCTGVPERCLVGDKMCYIAPCGETSTIILGDRVLKTEYLHIANVQEYDGKIVYIGWNDGNNKVIVVVDKDGKEEILKTEYLHIANVQEYDGKIVYVGWNDGNNKVIVVVDKDGTIKTYNIGTSTPKMFDEDTSLLPFAEIN